MILQRFRAFLAVALLRRAGIEISDADDYFGLEFSRSHGKLDQEELDALPSHLRKAVQTLREEHEAYLERED